MRVLSVSNFFDTHGGGIERVASHLSREFARAGHVSLWAACDADGLPDSPAELVALRCANAIEALTGLPMPIPGLKAARQLAAAVRGCDIVVIHDSLYFTSVLAMLLAKLHRKPTVLIQHISEIPFANPLMRIVIGLSNALVTGPMIAAAGRLVFISQTVRDDLLGVPPRRRSELIFNGVDQTVFNAGGRCSREETRARWSLPKTAPLMIFVGRFVEKKGLRIIRTLAERRPELHFVLLGKGPISPAEWGLGNVHVLGHQPQEAIADLYRASDALLLPSVGEGYPLVIQEAMACGLPVVCGVASAKADPGAGSWLSGVDIDLSDAKTSAAACAAALDRLVPDPPDREMMARYAAQTYSWSRMAEAVLGVAPQPPRRPAC